VSRRRYSSQVGKRRSVIIRYGLGRDFGGGGPGGGAGRGAPLNEGGYADSGGTGTEALM